VLSPGTRSLTRFSVSTVELIKFMTSPEAAPLLRKSYGAARALTAQTSG